MDHVRPVSPAGRSDQFALRHTLRVMLREWITTGQRAGIFREGDCEAFATIIMAGLASGGDSQGGGAADSSIRMRL